MKSKLSLLLIILWIITLAALPTFATDSINILVTEYYPTHPINVAIISGFLMFFITLPLPALASYLEHRASSTIEL